jgi:putative hydrolase of the HAD superfamily
MRGRRHEGSSLRVGGLAILRCARAAVERAICALLPFASANSRIFSNFRLTLDGSRLIRQKRIRLNKSLFPESLGRTPLPASTIAAKFAHVDTFVFDLDNTLYPPDSDLWPRIDARITLYLMNFFGLDGLSARAMQKFYYHRYGTTLKGLVDEYEINPADFLEFVHDIDRSSLAPDPVLGRQIAALPGRKLIFTNGSRDHALRTARQLGIDGMFEDVFDIVAARLVPKPSEATYQMFFDKHHVDPSRAAMFEDIAINLSAPHARGMTTTLVVPKAGQIDYRDRSDREGEDSPSIDFVTSDLASFLGAVNASLHAPVQA